MAARKAKKKAAIKSKQPAAPAADESPANNGDVTEEESIHNDADMEDANSSPDTVKQDTNAAEETADIHMQSKPTQNKTKSQEEPIMPFLDTFYQLSSDESKLRSVAARDLITHCFFSSTDEDDADDGVNASDAAYALTRLMNGLCTGRAASRQGYASALSTFLRISHQSQGETHSALSSILEVDSFGKDRMNGQEDVASVFRHKLLGATSFQQNDKGSGGGSKMKGMEERDHAFGRLFGILAVVRSGVLGLGDFPLEVCHIQYLIDYCVDFVCSFDVLVMVSVGIIFMCAMIDETTHKLLQ